MTERPKMQGIFVMSTDGLVVKTTEHFMNYNMLKNRAEAERIKKRWHNMRGVCPYCLEVGTWADFAFTLPDMKLSKMMKCPYCKAVMRQRMLGKYDENTAYGYGEWWWISWYNWEKFKDKVRPLFNRVKRRVRELGIANEFWEAQRQVKAGHYDAMNETKRLDKKVGLDRFV